MYDLLWVCNRLHLLQFVKLKDDIERNMPLQRGILWRRQQRGLHG